MLLLLLFMRSRLYDFDTYPARVPLVLKKMSFLFFFLLLALMLCTEYHSALKRVCS